MLNHSTTRSQLRPLPLSDSLGCQQPGIRRTTPLYPAISMQKKPLRVAVMLDEATVPRWVAEVLENIEQSGVAKVTTILWCRKSARRMDGKAGFSTILWRLYQQLDEKRHPALLTPFRPVALGEILGNVATLQLNVLDDAQGRHFSANDLNRLNAEALDVILHFDSAQLQGGILKAARYGIWSYHHGDDDRYRGGPAGFWEMYERNPVTGATLKILDQTPDGGRVIYRSVGATVSFESLAKNRFIHYRKTIPFVARCLRVLYERGPEGLAVEGPKFTQPNSLSHFPNNGQMLIFLGRALFRSLLSRIEQRLDLVHDHWFLAYALGRQTLPGRDHPVVALHPPEGHFWADPCVVKSKGEHYVFFEDYDYARGIGDISAFWIGTDGAVGPPQTILSTGKHLSYPFIFEWQDEHYMIPESSSERTVKLYRALNFPYQWALDSVLLDNIAAVDTTLIEHDERWYLFANISETGGSKWDELFLFIADSPLGPWSPHPMNPIVSNVQTARPAGALFRQDGKLYRPAQDCAKSYGASIAVQEILTLSPTEYRERSAYKIEPDWLPNIRGCHTISLCDEITLLDCKIPKRQPIKRQLLTGMKQLSPRGDLGWNYPISVQVSKDEIL
jgi:hypothetical protein